VTRPLTLASLASVPEREHLLVQALESLRPQVDRLHVYLNGYEADPCCVQDLADKYVLSPENHGAERKFHWAQAHAGVYLTCDDDFVYAEGYVATMVDAVLRWDGRAIVTAHGRTYRPQARNVFDVVPGSVGIIHKRVGNGRWVNHGGTGVMAWDASKLAVPTSFPERNLADMQLSVWAQLNQVPIWLIPHEAHWLKSLASLDPAGIFRSSQAEGHERRNRLIRQHAATHGWQLYEC
jgi:hypothetical protein